MKNKIIKIILSLAILINLIIGVYAVSNISHIYDRIAELEVVNSQQYHRILELENK